MKKGLIFDHMQPVRRSVEVGEGFLLSFRTTVFVPVSAETTEDRDAVSTLLLVHS